ncbi:PleD family two-component system response regulator [Candidatus Margulisiibacteriota bacterium]
MPKKILIIDSDENVHKKLELFLKAEGFEIIQSFNGEEGLSLVKAKLPNLVIMDANASKISGLVLISLLKKEPDTENIPVLLLTSGSPKITGFLYKSPTPYKLPKPVDTNDLINMAHEILSK